MKTVINNLNRILKIKNSTFYSYAYCNITSISNVSSIIANISQNHKNVKHICYSYRILEGNILKEFYEESTEPHGSSGLQIYNNLKKEDIVNSLVIIARDFGGTQLGIGLLSRTYNSATKIVLENNLMNYEKNNIYIIKITNKSFDYFQRNIELFKINIIEYFFDKSFVSLKISISSSNLEQFKEFIDILEIKKGYILAFF